MMRNVCLSVQVDSKYSRKCPYEREITVRRGKGHVIKSHREKMLCRWFRVREEVMRQGWML